MNLAMVNFVSKMLNFVFEMMNFVFKMMILGRGGRRGDPRSDDSAFQKGSS